MIMIFTSIWQKCMRKQLGSTGKLKISLENTVCQCMLPTCGQMPKQLFKKRLQAASVTEMEACCENICS